MKSSTQITPIEKLALLMDSFIVQKRAIGYKYDSMESSLRRFVRFAESYGLVSPHLPQELISEYCARRPAETPKTYACRCSDIRQFASFLNLNGFEAFVPAVPRKTRSDFTPYIFTHDEMERIFVAADSIKYHARYNCAEIYPVLFRMLYGCGLRVSEALDLCVRDVDLKSGVLTIRNSKYNKSRLVVMSPSLVEACFQLSNKIHIIADGDDYFFKNRNGSRRSKNTVSTRFRELLWVSGISYRGKGYGPRLHDVRHSFCCHALKSMSESGIDMYCSLPVLSTFVGHSTIKATEQYLRLTEEFYPDVAQKTHASFPSVYPEVYRVEAY
jgi:integrase